MLWIGGTAMEWLTGISDLKEGFLSKLIELVCTLMRMIQEGHRQRNFGEKSLKSAQGLCSCDKYMEWSLKEAWPFALQNRKETVNFDSDSSRIYSIWNT